MPESTASGENYLREGVCVSANRKIPRKDWTPTQALFEPSRRHPSNGRLRRGREIKLHSELTWSGPKREGVLARFLDESGSVSRTGSMFSKIEPPCLELIRGCKVDRQWGSPRRRSTDPLSFKTVKIIIVDSESIPSKTSGRKISDVKNVYTFLLFRHKDFPSESHLI